MINTWQVVFSVAKDGNAESEWEDGAAAAPADPRLGRGPRLAVADGATKGFGSARWAQQLVAGFVGADQDPAGPPALDRASLHPWALRMQERWRDDPRLAGATDLELRKLTTVGSFATFLGCELNDLDGPRPHWAAVALGDTVLFHVRANTLITQFPAIAADGFGFNPDGLPTRADTVADMVDRAEFGSGDLADGDQLYLATDAFAHWMVNTDLRDPAGLWATLSGLDHPGVFRKLVADQRAAGAMDNDDVTLMRVRFHTAAPEHLVVCL